MQLTSLVTVALFAAGALAASPKPPGYSGAYPPAVRYPKKGTAWYKGETDAVVWDHPQGMPNTNNTAVFLRKGDQLYGDPLRKNFNLTDGIVFIEVPFDAPAGADWTIALFANGGQSTGAVFRIRDERSESTEDPAFSKQPQPTPSPCS